MRANHQKMKMEKINGCLKGLFISLNALLAILGSLMIFAAIKSSASHQLSEVISPVWIWLLAIGILSISYLGFCAGLSENEIILKIFAGFMGVGMIIVLIFGIIVVVTRNKFESSFDSTESFMKNEELRTMLNELQQGDHCCGVVNVSDWGDNIPNSCECYGERKRGYNESKCTFKPWGVRGPDRIYAQPCIEIAFGLIESSFKVIMGMFLGFAVTALLGLLISFLMIREIQHHDSSGGSYVALKGY